MPSPYVGQATLYREADEIVFEGAGGWCYRVSLEQVSDDQALGGVLGLLASEPWMDEGLREQFRVEVLWLRQQLPPGK